MKTLKNKTMAIRNVILIALSICAFVSIHAKALTYTYTGHMSLTSAKGLNDEVKE